MLRSLVSALTFTALACCEWLTDWTNSPCQNSVTALWSFGQIYQPEANPTSYLANLSSPLAAHLKKNSKKSVLQTILHKTRSTNLKLQFFFFSLFSNNPNERMPSKWLSNRRVNKKGRKERKKTSPIRILCVRASSFSLILPRSIPFHSR